MAKRRRNKKPAPRRTRPRPNPRLRSPFEQFLTGYKNNSFFQSRRSSPDYNYFSPVIRNSQPIITSVSYSDVSPRNRFAPKLKTGTLNDTYSRAIICAKRQQRKEILHALNHTGKSGQRRPTDNIRRSVRCS